MCPEDEQTTELQQALAENPLQADVSIDVDRGVGFVLTCLGRPT